MKHKGTIQLETKRLILRQFTVLDAPKMFKNWANSEKVTEFLTWAPHKSEEETKGILSLWEKNYSQPNFYQWAIELKEIGEPIGSISVVKIDEELGEVVTGYCIGEKWWRKGIVTEAYKRVIELLFNEIGVNRITGRHDVNNPNSGKVMLKCGLTYEGTLREGGVHRRGICDLAIYSILAKEYKGSEGGL